MSKKRVSLNDRLNKPITTAVSAFTTNSDVNNVIENDTNKGVKNNTKSDTDFVTKNETKIAQIKNIKLGNTTFKSTYTNCDNLKRSAYTLREDTIEKINKCSKIYGMKKAEFVDLILNSILTDILNKINK